VSNLREVGASDNLTVAASCMARIWGQGTSWRGAVLQRSDPGGFGSGVLGPAIGTANGRKEYLWTVV